MRPYLLLYCRGHRVGRAGGLVLLVAVVLSVAEGRVVDLPWLDGIRHITVGTFCALAYALVPVMLFRNELSRLEVFAARSWLRIDATIVTVLWLIPWAGAAIDAWTVRFAYASTLSLGMVLVFGTLMRVDTLALSLVAVLVIQSALWGSVEGTPWRHLLFLLDELPPTIMLTVSVFALPIMVVCLPRLKAGPRTTMA